MRACWSPAGRCACMSRLTPKLFTCVAHSRSGPQILVRKLAFDPLGKQRRRSLRRATLAQAASDPALGDDSSSTSSTITASSSSLPSTTDTSALPENFCIIESRDSVKNFANMQLEEIRANIAARRNRIFLLMEEVRRLRIQQRLKGDATTGSLMTDAEDELEEAYPSSIPFFPPVTQKTFQLYVNFYFLSVASIILFGALIAPSLEVKLGLGGTSYYDFIASMHLPTQLAEVDPIVASFCGGAVGVLTSLLVVEANNAKMQSRSRCIYCEGTGYLTCGNCLGTGVASDAAVAAVAGPGSSGQAAAAAAAASQVQEGPCTCSYCSGTGKVMCTACLCTGKQLATEHDPRVDPFTLID